MLKVQDLEPHASHYMNAIKNVIKQNNKESFWIV